MATTSTPTSGSSARIRGGGSDSPAHVRPRRNVPLVLFGVLVVAGCSLAFALTSLNTGGRQPVLAITRTVPAGHVLTDADLTVVRVHAPPSVPVIGQAEHSSVVGRPVAVPLVARSLLTREALGAVSTLAADQAVIGIAVKPGRYPPALTPGATVQAYAVPAEPAVRSSTQTADQVALPIGTATVLMVERGGEGGDAVLELQLLRDDVPQVAAAAASGSVSLALIAPRS